MENKVHLYMATLPDRTGTFLKALSSIANQVGTIQIALPYDYRPVQTWGNPRATIVRHDNSLKDGSRFINAHKKPGYCLVCDDDIEYPPDYVERMIEVYESTPYIAFLAPMGKILKPRPLQSYYRGWAKNYRTFSEVPKLARVDIPGCCGILWHTDRVQVNEYDMVVPNSDVCVGVLAHNRGLKCAVIPHAADWLKDLSYQLPKGTLDIYNRYKNDDKLQTDFINRWMR